MLKWISISTLILHENYISKCSVTSNSHLSGRPDFSPVARPPPFPSTRKKLSFRTEDSLEKNHRPIDRTFVRISRDRVDRVVVRFSRRWTDRKRGKRTPVGMEWGNCGRRRKSRVSPDGSVGPRVDTVARSRLEPSCLRFSKFRKIMRLSSNDNSYR